MPDIEDIIDITLELTQRDIELRDRLIEAMKEDWTRNMEKAAPESYFYYFCDGVIEGLDECYKLSTSLRDYQDRMGELMPSRREGYQPILEGLGEEEIEPLRKAMRVNIPEGNIDQNEVHKLIGRNAGIVYIYTELIKAKNLDFGFDITEKS